MQFTVIPSSLRLPGAFAEVDNSRANVAQGSQRALLIGNKTAAGIAAADTPVLISSVDDARAKFGVGSLLAQMAFWYRQNDAIGEVWGAPVADAGGGAFAAGSINFTAAATAAGTLSLYIHGDLVSVALTGSQTAAQIATAVVAAINALTNLAVTAAVNGGITSQVDITAKNKGLTGNDIDIRLNYLGSAGGEALPTTLAATIVQPTGGTTNPTLTTVLANCADNAFDFIVIPWSDTTSLDALKTFLDGNTGRWSYLNQLFGGFFVAYKNTFANSVTLTTGRNDPAGVIMPAFDSPMAPWAWAAAIGAQVAIADRANHGQPYTSLPLVGIKAPPPASRFTKTQRNTLLLDGASTFTVDPDGTVRIERLVTTYQLNALGQADVSYLNAETRFLLMFLIRQFIALVQTKYSRKKLVARGSVLPADGSVVSPDVMESDFIALHRTLEFQGFTQQSDRFAALIKGQVDINPSNLGMVQALLPLFPAGQLFTTAMLVQFRLS